MHVEIIMPKMGESIQEGTILRWIKKVGDTIEKDETILEISTDKVDSDIPSPVSGILSRVLAKEQDIVPVGSIIAYIETDQTTYRNVQAPSGKEPFLNVPGIPSSKSSQEFQSSPAKSSPRTRTRFYSPLVRTIAQKEGIAQHDLESISGSGSGGRVTKADVLQYLERRTYGSSGMSLERDREGIKSVSISDLEKIYPAPQYRIVSMDTIQKKMAEHLSRSVRTSPHVTVVDEADLTEIMNYRLSILEKFEKEHGFKLTVTPFFAYAAVIALKEFPVVNSSIEGNAIIYKNFINLGIAVASPSGLMVPVVHQAEKKSFIELARALTDAAVRARTKKLMPDDLAGGTFSITNYGIFGSIIGTPIISQPQAAILGIGAIKKRPMVQTDEEGRDTIQIRSMAYLTHTFDHRIIDGAIGGQFLARVKWYIENFRIDLV